MPKQNNDSDLVDQYQKQLKNKLFLWVVKQHISVKILMGIVVLSGSIYLGSFGFFGDNTRDFMKTIWPKETDSSADSLKQLEIKKKYIDSLYWELNKRVNAEKDISQLRHEGDGFYYLKDQEIDKYYSASILPEFLDFKPSAINKYLPLKNYFIDLFPSSNLQQEHKVRLMPQLTFKINRQSGYNRENYKKGDQIELFLTLNKPCFVVLMHIDSEGYNYLGHNTPEWYDKITDKSLGSYTIDSIEGFESYYVFSSYDNFDVADIESLVETKQELIKDLHSKGITDPFSIEAPTNIVSDHIYFYANYTK